MDTSRDRHVRHHRDLQRLEDLVVRELDRRRDLAEPEVEAVEGARRIVDDVHVLDAHVLDGDLED
jgi:hypothetical protein